MPHVDTTPSSAASTVSPLDETRALLERLGSGPALSVLAGISLEKQEALYYLGYALYNQAKYEDAGRLFVWLMGLSPYDCRYPKGFAACLQMQQRHQEAVRFYSLSSMLDATDPEPVMHAAECYLSLGDRAHACTSIAYALKHARAHEAHRPLVDRLESMQAFLDNSPTEKSQEPSRVQS